MMPTDERLRLANEVADHLKSAAEKADDLGHLVVAGTLFGLLSLLYCGHIEALGRVAAVVRTECQDVPAQIERVRERKAASIIAQIQGEH